MQKSKPLLSAARRAACAFLALMTLVAALVVGGCNKGSPVDPVNENPGGCFPNSHETPGWSSQGLIAYRDNGIVFPLHPGGAYHVDLSLRGTWVLDPETGETERILSDGWFPAWSPDGSKLALVLGNGQIYTMNADGTGLTQLTFSESNVYPDWSPDGDRIAWNQSGGSAPGVWIMSSSGENQEPVFPLGGCPDWHPTAEVLLCDGWYDSAQDQGGIFEYDLVSESVTVLREHVGDIYAVHPRYSPDGSRIAFCELDVTGTASEDDIWSVWVMDAAGSNARQLTWDGGSNPSWSPDGTRLVYTRELWDYWDAGTSEDGVLWVVDVETGDREQLRFQWEAEEEP